MFDASPISEALANEEYDDAIELASAALEGDPGLTEVQLLRAEAYLAQGESDAALADANQVLARHPGHASALETRARIYIALELPNRAIQDCRSILEADRHDARAFRTGAVATFRKGQVASALALAGRALELGDESARGLIAAWTQLDGPKIANDWH